MLKVCVGIRITTIIKIPIIIDNKDNILSVPPIINSDLTKISTNTKDVFIEITATDKHKAVIALKVLFHSFGLYSKDHKIENVKIIDGENI